MGVKIGGGARGKLEKLGRESYKSIR